MAKRQKFSKEFKLEAVRLLEQADKPLLSWPLSWGATQPALQVAGTASRQG